MGGGTSLGHVVQDTYRSQGVRLLAFTPSLRCAPLQNVAVWHSTMQHSRRQGNVVLSHMGGHGTTRTGMVLYLIGLYDLRGQGRGPVLHRISIVRGIAGAPRWRRSQAWRRGPVRRGLRHGECHKSWQKHTRQAAQCRASYVCCGHGGRLECTVPGSWALFSFRLWRPGRPRAEVRSEMKELESYKIR